MIPVVFGVLACIGAARVLRVVVGSVINAGKRLRVGARNALRGLRRKPAAPTLDQSLATIAASLAELTSMARDTRKGIP